MSQIEYTKIPQVMLLGNGLIRSCNGISWHNLIDKIAVRTDLPEKLNCPEPLQAILATNDNIRDAMKEYQKDFMGEVSSSLQVQLQIVSY